MINNTGRWLGAIAILLFLAGGSAFGKILKQVSWDCGDGRRGNWTMFEDDCTGEIHTIMLTCTGKMYTGVPKPEFGRALSGDEAIALPPNFIDQLQAAELSATGGYSGVRFTADGESVSIISPATEEEHRAILAAWDHQSNSGSLE